MKIVVIGSKGFIGSHCVAYFTSIGYEVIGCDILDIIEPNYFSLKSINNDVSRLFKNDVDYCINSAGSANVSYSFQYPEKDFELNVSLVINLLGAIKKKAPNCKVVNFSSAAVYGNPVSLPVKEDADTKPLSPYGYHKLLSEKLFSEYHHFFNLKTCSLRVFSAYGPGLKKQLFWDIYSKTVTNKTINLFGTGKESRDFIYISDLVKAVECVMNKAKFSGETINVASGIELTISDAANLFLESIDSKKELLFNEETKSGDPKNWQADISALKKLGFKPITTLIEGLKEYSKWLKKTI